MLALKSRRLKFRNVRLLAMIAVIALIGFSGLMLAQFLNARETSERSKADAVSCYKYVKEGTASVRAYDATEKLDSEIIDSSYAQTASYSVDIIISKTTDYVKSKIDYSLIPFKQNEHVYFTAVVSGTNMVLPLSHSWEGDCIGAVSASQGYDSITSTEKTTQLNGYTSTTGESMKCKIKIYNGGMMFNNPNIRVVAEKEITYKVRAGDNVCGGEINTINATFCENDLNNVVAGNNTFTLVNTCTDAKKCEFKCNDGFVNLSGECVATSSLTCQGTDFADSTLCDGDGTGLTGITSKALVDFGGCTSGTKCEYQCKSDRYFKSGTGSTAVCLARCPFDTSVTTQEGTGEPTAEGTDPEVCYDLYTSGTTKMQQKWKKTSFTCVTPTPTPAVQLACTSPLTECDDECVNLNNDEDNCGSCGNDCDNDEICISKSCVSAGVGSLSAYKYGNTIIMNAYSVDGSRSFLADCDFTSDTTTAFDIDCDWTQSNVERVGGTDSTIDIKALTAYTYTKSGALKIREIGIGESNSKIYYRECPYSESSGPTFTNCTWREDTTNVESLTDAIKSDVTAIDAYTYTKSSVKYVEHVVFTDGGDDAYIRVCKVKDTGPDFADCTTGWTKYTQFFTTLKNDLGVNGFTVGSFAGYVYEDKKNSIKKIKQIVIDEDGYKTYSRDCRVEASTDPAVPNCTKWEEDTEHAPNLLRPNAPSISPSSSSNFTDSLEVTISAEDGVSEIRYTLDGSDVDFSSTTLPATSSTRSYKGDDDNDSTTAIVTPLVLKLKLTSTTTVKARAFRNGNYSKQAEVEYKKITLASPGSLAQTCSTEDPNKITLSWTAVPDAAAYLLIIDKKDSGDTDPSICKNLKTLASSTTAASPSPSTVTTSSIKFGPDDKFLIVDNVSQQYQISGGVDYMEWCVQPINTKQNLAFYSAEYASTRKYLSVGSKFKCAGNGVIIPTGSLPPGVTPYPSGIVTGLYLDSYPSQTYSNSVTLTGRKPANTGVTLNGSVVVPSDSSSTWSYAVSVPNLGANNYALGLSGASTATASATIKKCKLADINCDGRVYIDDFQLFIQAYQINKCSTNTSQARSVGEIMSDLSNDKKVCVNDYGMFVNAYKNAN